MEAEGLGGKKADNYKGNQFVYGAGAKPTTNSYDKSPVAKK
eukprot:CAMPEP_0177380896 /NCGR_PEP_ID=MMETSP0368-20130122/47767_1 /TAXON_ID=447022 ORGANISM="Scrippsiella hangoei-like, Strain SHHI-4" /NCGR_SAMPLE_ID=MMETSP0368 /ASSEMBLY_ACC=CAM_ASM_000363 /LENGTH=40 /DNA_ID= /DNA_START= /DNA_END= /DNA_ORIENTATION=